MKRIVICGAGEVGRYASELLAEEGHEVTVIDNVAKRLEDLEESVDIGSIKGSSCHADVLKEANVAECDLLIAATNQDEVNLLTAALAKKMGCKKVVSRLHQRSYLNQKLLNYRETFDIDHLICPEQLTSLEIASNIADLGVLEIQHFADSKLEMHRYKIDKKSKASGLTLAGLSLPPHVRMAVIKRNHRYLIPDASTVLQTQDIVTLIGVAESFSEIQRIFQQAPNNKKVVIMGATSMAEWLAEDLHHRNFSIRLFETDQKKAIDFSERFPFLTVVNADPSDPSIFESERLENSAAFIAVSDDDEHNILAAVQAKKLGIQTTASVIHSKTFLPLLDILEIELPFSPRLVAAKSILRFAKDSAVKSVFDLAPKVARIYEVGPVTGGPGVNIKLRDIQFPKGTFIAAIHREEHVKVPGAEDTVLPNDDLVVIGPSNVEKFLNEQFIK